MAQDESSRRTHTHPRRHLQHPPRPGPRRPHAPRADRGGAGDHRRRRRGAAGSGGRLAAQARTGRGAGRRPRHGLGDGADPPPAHRALRQRRPQPAAGPPARAARPDVEDLRAAERPARGHRDRGRTCCTSTTCTWARRCSSGGTRRRASPRWSTTSASPDRRSCWAISTSGPAAWPPTSWRSGCRASTCASTCGGVRTYPGFFPILHLDHIYYEGHVEVLKVTLPRDRLSLMASDHLPLVADLKIGF